MNLTEPRPREHVGIVTSDTTTTRFGFFVTSLKNKSWIGMEDYVTVDHPVFGEECPILGSVKEIRNYEQVVGTTVNEKSVQTVATSEIVGYVDQRHPQGKPLRKLTMPPSPGSKVYLPSFEFLEDVFLRDSDGKLFGHPLYVGTLESQAVAKNGDLRPLSFCLNADDLACQHLLVTGISGSGKTHTATVIVEELANKTDCPVVIFDTHGEYLSVGMPARHFPELFKDDPAALRSYPFNFKVSLFAYDVEMEDNALKRIAAEPEKEERVIVESVRSELFDASYDKASTKIKETVTNMLRSRTVTILDAQGMPETERSKFFTRCADMLWRAKMREDANPFVLILEDSATIEKETLETIASEGRKAGVSLCLLSQHPADLSSAVLSQMGAQLMGRTTDTEDLECLKNMAGDKLTLLPQLTRGEWVANGMTLMKPRTIDVRERYSRTS